MSLHSSRVRFAAVLAVVAALFASGMVAGAAGQALILGQANSAGSTDTSLTSSGIGSALLVTQNGSGTAIRGSTGSGTGIAGFFTSGSGSGVSGVVANQNSYGVYAANDAITTGTGAALRANGKSNSAIIASSASKPPLVISGPPDAAPMTLNSGVKVANLNADKLDGLDAASFAAAAHDHPDYLAVEGTAADSDKLDGMHASAFLPAARYEISTTGVAPVSGMDTVDVACDEGDVAITGGYFGINDDPGNDSTVSSDFPLLSTTWRVEVINNGGATEIFGVRVVCADFPPLTE